MFDTGERVPCAVPGDFGVDDGELTPKEGCCCTFASLLDGPSVQPLVGDDVLVEAASQLFCAVQFSGICLGAVPA